ncbi:hypothetical protein CSKR_114424, partial [Clonorchis sinensis]
GRDSSNGYSVNLLTGRSVVRTRPLPLDFPCLGLGNLAVSQPSCFLWVAWQLGTERPFATCRELVYTNVLDSGAPDSSVVRVVRIQPQHLDCSCLGLDDLAASEPSRFLRVEWQLGTERVLQMNSLCLRFPDSAAVQYRFVFSPFSSYPSLDRGSREAEVRFEPRTFRSVNSRSNQLGHLDPNPRTKSVTNANFAFSISLASSPPHVPVATIFEISRYMYIRNGLLIRLLKTLRQPTTGFALLGAHQLNLSFVMFPGN